MKQITGNSRAGSGMWAGHASACAGASVKAGVAGAGAWRVGLEAWQGRSSSCYQVVSREVGVCSRLESGGGGRSVSNVTVCEVSVR